MKNLLIIGAGGCGREVLQWAKDVNTALIREGKQPRWNIKGFLDDNPRALDGKKCDICVLSSVDDYEISENDEFICSIGSSVIRERVMDKMKERGAAFTGIVHPTAIVADSAVLGEAVIIYPFALISDNAVIGDGCIVNMYSSIAHDSKLGRYCTISAHCDVTGMCTLGEHVFMGTTSNLVPSSRVGNHVYICAGSTVMTRLRDGVKVLGCPARKVAL
ncbi:MAG: NeuD/PglB/VioB family sugar acetyltransferase [Lachnospiraceae bacterium]|nr:NeuD/PglB/VioB family sugar acetyltransferase [Lachnospiraceae bacterium]